MRCPYRGPHPLLRLSLYCLCPEVGATLCGRPGGGQPRGATPTSDHSTPDADFTTGAAALSGKADSPPTTRCTSSNVKPFVSGA